MADLEQLRRAHEDLYASYAELIGQLDGDDWHLPTGCPGWSVRDIVAHVVGFEAVLSGDPEPDPQLPDDLPHVRNEMGRYMETHVDARRRVGLDELVAEAREVFGRRRAALAEIEDLGEEIPSAMGSTGPAAPVLTVRVLDLWMHEQDLRRAVGRPGHRSGPAVDVALRRLVRGVASELPGRSEGASGVAVIEVTGETPWTIAVDLESGERLAEPAEDPAVHLRMDLDAFVALAGGRADAPEASELDIEGDADLGRRLVGALAVTP